MMHRPMFHSELSSPQRPSEATRIAYLENELSRLVPATRFNLPIQPLDVMIRGLTSSRSLSDCHQERIQYLKDEQDRDSSDRKQMDAFS